MGAHSFAPRVISRYPLVGLLICILMLTVNSQTVPDCFILPNTDGATPYDGTKCVCHITDTTRMVWDSTTQTGCLFKCSVVVNSDQGASALSCNCNSGYQWNPDTGVCEADCANDVHSDGTMNSDGTCTCNNQYIFSK